jgi:hypothetical protein
MIFSFIRDFNFNIIPRSFDFISSSVGFIGVFLYYDLSWILVTTDEEFLSAAVSKSLLQFTGANVSVCMSFMLLRSKLT